MKQRALSAWVQTLGAAAGHPLRLFHDHVGRRIGSALSSFLARRACPSHWVPVIGLAATFGLLAWLGQDSGELRHGVVVHLVHEPERSWIEGNDLTTMRTVVDDEDWKVVFRGAVGGASVLRRVFVTENVYRSLEVGGEFSMDYFRCSASDEDL